MTRRQCAKCPWKTTTDPRDIPNGYCETKHAGLRRTIANEEDPLATVAQLRVFTCHETARLPCVGWLVHQLNEGNNIGLRLAVATGRISADVETIGPQHQRFEDTLPQLELDTACPSCGGDPDVDCICKGQG